MELMKPISLVTESVSPSVCPPPIQLSLWLGVDTFHSVGVPFISFSAFRCVFIA